MIEVDVDPETRYAVGLDIGDGESCLFWLDTTDPAAEAQLYERSRPVERTVLTALARRRETGEWIFGEAALLAGDAFQFVVNLKKAPVESFSTPDAVQFAQAFLDEFFSAHPEVKTSCQIMIGYPTGWPQPARDIYQRFLRTSDIPLAVLPESQSALVHVWDLRRRQPAGARQDIDNVLVIDIGSSTVDVTMVSALNPVNIPVGADLGCRDIDDELARRVTGALAGDPAFDRAMTSQDSPMLLRFVCRRAKEAQFGGHGMLVHDRPEALNPRLGAIMDHATAWLRAQDIPHLVERGWAGRLRDLLLDVRDKLEHQPEVVVLTGGGSRMPVTRRICAQLFPDASHELDDEPSFSVGRGLASAGRHRIQAMRFRRDATGVAARPEVAQALRDATVEAFATVRDQTVALLRETDPQQWGDLIESPPPGLPDAARGIEEAVDASVRPLVHQICDAYEIPHGHRDLDTRLAPDRLFISEFTQRVTEIPRASLPDVSDTDLSHATVQIGRFAMQGFAGAQGVLARLRGGIKAGGQAALIAGAMYLVFAGGSWAVQTVAGQRRRRQVLNAVATMELPGEAITTLEHELAAEIARVVGERVAPLERMVR
ncbi:Hsp70 family protein [Kibdelosporangium phytohabitans]|uniref:Molecular chaperone DnaK n=1 Tax=Kibdelosporangium phytohabitans TaxID=860235 RepID=A0A0N9HYH1_9PSEU|nr:hypothetical protein [Kibdelosporangium phytohabitans]ALG10572.1 hypothetical protein AOZ06_30030 [Kibdelosporangium phytohabitans]MBE1461677.1 hypothetical protein [Kibdelosporangium phytohabitans]